jgi:hypothetical protein
MLGADATAANCAKAEKRRKIAGVTDRLLLVLDTSSQKTVCHQYRSINSVPDARRISSSVTG